MEKGGKSCKTPVRHDLELFILQDMDAALLREAAKELPLFCTTVRKTKQITDGAMSGIDICRMMKRRLRDAGLPSRLSPHSFRVATITDLLDQGARLATYGTWSDSGFDQWRFKEAEPKRLIVVARSGRWQMRLWIIGAVGVLILAPLATVGSWGRVVAAPVGPEADKPGPSLAEGPQVRPSEEAGIGRLVRLHSAPDLAGKPVNLDSVLGPQGLVLAVVSSSCPAGKRFAPALGRLSAEYSKRGVAFAYLAPIDSDASGALSELARNAGIRGPLLRDKGGKLCARLGITSSTEVLLLDSRRTLVYRGAVSDQYGPTWSLDKPRRSYLSDALTALVTGSQPQVAATTAPGCALQAGTHAVSSPPVTYHAQIARIVQTHCAECHRKDGLAPFSLETLKDVTSHAGMIERVVAEGRMPPWFAAPAPEGQPSRWANDRTVPASEKKELLAWLRGGNAPGDPKDAPLPRRFDPAWAIGKPDVTFQIPKPAAVKAEGTMPYATQEVETGFTEDRWVQAIEVAPTDRSVVHHVLVFVRPPSAGRDVNELRDELSGFFGIYVPGNSTLVYPEGFAKKIPAGARLRFQIHYTPNGKATTDQTRLGLKFAPEKPKHEVRVAALANLRLAIPPGAADHPERAALTIPTEAHIMAFLPHLHLRGKAARYEVTSPDGAREVLLDVPRYDFNWQLYYRLKEPFSAKPGSRLEFTGRFDNSAGNRANPDPQKLVRWGPQTYDEMLLGYVEYYTKDGGPAIRPGLRPGPRPRTGAGAGRGMGVETLFQRADRNGDGKITPEELPNEQLFKRLDVNADGVVTLEEARQRLPPLR